MDTHTQKFKVRLGLFIAVGLAIFVIAVFLIGKQKNLFNPVYKLTANKPIGTNAHPAIGFDKLHYVFAHQHLYPH